MTTNLLRQHAYAPLLFLSLSLAACAASLTPAEARQERWPPAWDGGGIDEDLDAPSFDAPKAANCRRLPMVRELPGGGGSQSSMGPRGASGEEEARRLRRGEASDLALAEAAPPAPPTAVAAGEARATAKSVAPRAPAADVFAPPAALQALPEPSARSMPQRPAQERVTAAMVDDNADFGAFLDYRKRHTGLAVRDRDISERYLLEVTDAGGRPVHDAEVVVQRTGEDKPVMWARTDAAGRVWLHPRAFLKIDGQPGSMLRVAARKGGWTSTAPLLRGQSQAVQLRLGGKPAAVPTRLDLVFLVDATGSMGDEIAKLKSSMRAMAQQISQLPGRPDICYGLVAYRDRGDAFLTRSHDFTDDLGAFQDGLARLQAGGGGDTPEALNEALHETVHSLSWRADAVRLAVLVADAPPHLDYTGCQAAHEATKRCPQYDRGMQAALAKGIKLFAVGASGLDPVGEYVFRQMAQYTAGRFVFLTYRDADNPGSGPGTQTVHDVRGYSVQTLDKLVVRLVDEELAKLGRN
jgi:Mg-chelatase subunit ChlD